jgi:hypothetical protein
MSSSGQGVSGKYAALLKRLADSGGSIELDFTEVDDLVGGLPPSSRSYREWWANSDRNPQARAWLTLGMRVSMVSLDRERVRFVRG